MTPKLPKYKYLITYRLAEIIFDLVDAFVLKYLSNLGPLSYLSLKEQMLKCARSIKQNIIEAVSEITSLKTQIKLLGVAYASVEELIADLEDFLRRKNLLLYPKTHPKVAQYRALGARLSHFKNLNHAGQLKEKPTLPTSAEEAANLLLTLCHQLSFLLARQIENTEEKFIRQGGYTENLFSKRIKYRKSPKILKPPKFPSLSSSFTLMELLIIIALIALILIAILIFLNPKKQLEKAWDSKRKSDLSLLKKVFEDFYNDKNCYPLPEDVCFDTPITGSNEKVCHICGLRQPPPNFSSFSPYLKTLPCDPQSPKYDYLYKVENKDCPSWFQIYARLSNKKDPIIEELKCQGYSCGSNYTTPKYGYNYGEYSPNSQLETSQLFYCCDRYGSCLQCSNTYQGCYQAQECVDKEKIWGSRDLCRCR